ncbi:MAG: YlmH/Sll1252 family protein [Muribaculaceae bacterium]|nr:YlmH/Sll1252 family protein [Muribaculaceae bacterium]MCM1398964.1 YlmH/Sll1252 family protein [Clostridium sp.]MCM1458822.1 YlmH/Sll1252 family protein [Bacteroides sp.]
MDELQILKAHILDLAKKAYRQNIYTYTGFLNTSELAVLYSLGSELDGIDFEANGGYEMAERQMVRFGSPAMFGYDEPWRLTILKATPLVEKFADTLSHRDFLGALMNLGIERSVLGDVIIKENRDAFIICQNSMAEYITENLTKVKHTSIQCLPVNSEEDLNALKPTLIDIDITVAAPRFDAVVAGAIRCSRKEAHAMFITGKVTLNGMPCERNSMALKEGDIFSIRGYGKFQYAGCGHETRKGRIYVHLKQYK